MSDLFDIQFGPDAHMSVAMDGPSPVVSIEGAFTYKFVKGSGKVSIEVDSLAGLELVKAIAPANKWLAGIVNAIEAVLPKAV